MDPRLHPLSEQDFDLAGIDIVVNTHLHFDHCGGNRLFAGKPIAGPHPRHTGIVVETGGRPVVVAGDVAVWFGELDEPHTEGQLLVRALDPELVWLAHEHGPWRP